MEEKDLKTDLNQEIFKLMNKFTKEGVDPDYIFFNTLSVALLYVAQNNISADEIEKWVGKQ